MAYQVNLTTRFRGITSRTGLLLQGPAGWGEWSPFPEYERPEIKCCPPSLHHVQLLSAAGSS